MRVFRNGKEIAWPPQGSPETAAPAKGRGRLRREAAQTWYFVRKVVMYFAKDYWKPDNLGFDFCRTGALPKRWGKFRKARYADVRLKA